VTALLQKILTGWTVGGGRTDDRQQMEREGWVSLLRSRLSIL